MADEPSNAELAWRLDELRNLIQGLVGRAEYLAWQQGLEYRFNGLQQQIADERTAREAGDKKLGERVDEQARSGVEHRMHWWKVILTGVLPAFVTGMGILVTWLISRGGH